MSSKLLDEVDILFTGKRYRFYFSPGERISDSNSRNPTICYSINGSEEKTLFQLVSSEGSLFEDSLKLSNYFISVINDFHAERFDAFREIKLTIFGTKTVEFVVGDLSLNNKEDHDYWINFFLSAMKLHLALQ